MASGVLNYLGPCAAGNCCPPVQEVTVLSVPHTVSDRRRHAAVMVAETTRMSVLLFPM
jgi:hypothetical protein